MTNNFSLTPLFRSTVGFDRFNDLFESALSNNLEAVPNYPPYNIEKYGEDNYSITIAVAGFKDNDIEIIADGDTLTISGKIIEEKKDDNTEYLYKGIATRSFERKFSIADHVKVVSASLEDGLLKVELEREVPEELKPKVIPIKTNKKLDKK